MAFAREKGTRSPARFSDSKEGRPYVNMGGLLVSCFMRSVKGWGMGWERDLAKGWGMDWERDSGTDWERG